MWRYRAPVKLSSDAQALALVPLFRSLSPDELAFIARVSERLSLPAGDVIIEQGQHGAEFVVLLSGAAVVTRDGESVATLGPGDFAGELALLDPAPRTATVTITEAADVLLLGTREFWSVLSSSPGLDKKLLVALARRLRAAESHLA